MQQEYGLKQQTSTREQSMDSALESELEEGEELLWFGQPTADSNNRPTPARVFIILVSIFGSFGLIFLVLGILFLAVFGIEAAGLPLTIIGGTFLFIALLYTFISIILSNLNSAKNTIYAVTDRRIIIMEKNKNTIVDSYGKKDIGPISRIERPDGTGDLIFTSNRGGNSYYNNYNGTSSNTNNGSWNGNINKGRMQGIAGVKEVERLIRRTF
jgi:hypothetical protein